MLALSADWAESHSINETTLIYTHFDAIREAVGFTVNRGVDQRPYAVVTRAMHRLPLPGHGVQALSRPVHKGDTGSIRY